MNILEIVVKCISWISYAIGYNSNIGEKRRIVAFFENVYSYTLDTKIRNMLTMFHFRLGFLNHAIRKSKLDKSFDNDDDVIVGIIKEAVKDDNSCDIENEDNYITSIRCIEQIDAATNKGYIQGVFIKSILSILNILGYSDYEEGKKGLIKCAKWNHLPSMISLAYIYFVEEEYKKSLYYFEMINNINDSYLSSELKERYELIKSKINKKQYNLLMDEVYHDNEISHLLSDDRLNNNINRTMINSSISEVIYSHVFKIKEIEHLLFTNYNVEWNVISDIIKGIKKPMKVSRINKSNLNDEHKCIMDVIIKEIKEEKPKPIIINSSDDFVNASIIKMLKTSLKEFYVEEINLKQFYSNNLQKNANNNNIFFKALTSSFGNKFFFIYENLVNDNDNLGLYLDIINPSNEYQFTDLKLGVSKNNMISIVISKNINNLPKSLLEMAIVINIQKPKNTDKVQFIKEYFINEQENSNYKGVVVDEDVYEYLSTIPTNAAYNAIHQILNDSSSNKESIKLTKVKSIISKKEVPTIGFIGGD